MHAPARPLLRLGALALLLAASARRDLPPRALAAPDPSTLQASQTITTSLDERSPDSGFLGAPQGLVGVDGGLRSHLLLMLPSHLIPDGAIGSVTLNLYLQSGAWSGSGELRGYRVTDASGWFSGATDGPNAPAWNRRGADPNSGVPLPWAGLPGASQEGADFLPWQPGDPSLTLGPAFAPGYQSFAIPPAWLAAWRDQGQNHGLLLKLADESLGGLLATADLTSGANPPYLQLTYTPGPLPPAQARVIASDGEAQATWHANSFKVAAGGGRTFVAYARQDHHWATRWLDGSGWHQGAASPVPNYQAPALLIDASGSLHLFAVVPSPAGPYLLRHYRSTQPYSVDDFDPGEDVAPSWGYLGANIGPDGSLYAASTEPTTYNINLASKPPGGTWSVLTVVQGHSTQRRGVYPSIFVEPNGTLHLLYSIAEVVTGGFQYTLIGYARSADGGASWQRSDGSPLALPIAAGTDEHVEQPGETGTFGSQLVVTTSGKVHVLYHRDNGSSCCQVMHARRDASGWTWNTPHVDPNHSTDAGAMVEDPNGRIHVLFALDLSAVSSFSDDDGTSWQGGDVLYASTSPPFFFVAKPDALNAQVEVLFSRVHEYGDVLYASLPVADRPLLSACAPRPDVAVSVAPAGPDRLQVSLQAGTAPGTLVNWLRQLRFGATSNALVDIAGETYGVGNFTLPLPLRTRQTSFFVRRATPGQSTTVPLTVADSCGAWPTLVGGGPAAF